jgi:hypothetical protein
VIARDDAAGVTVRAVRLDPFTVDRLFQAICDRLDC